MKTSKKTRKNEQAEKDSILQEQDTNPQWLTLSACKKILNTETLQYTDEEILAIRDFLYRLAAFGAEQNLLEQEEANTVFNPLNYGEDEKIVFVYPQRQAVANRRKRRSVSAGRSTAAMLPVTTTKYSKDICRYWPVINPAQATGIAAYLKAINSEAKTAEEPVCI